MFGCERVVGIRSGSGEGARHRRRVAVSGVDARPVLVVKVDWCILRHMAYPLLLAKKT